MDFSKALSVLRAGRQIRRAGWNGAGWNGAGLWLALQRPDEGSKMTLPCIYLEYPPGDAYPEGARVPWLASQTDLLSDDWTARLGVPPVAQPKPEPECESPTNDAQPAKSADVAKPEYDTLRGAAERAGYVFGHAATMGALLAASPAQVLIEEAKRHREGAERLTQEAHFATLRATQQREIRLKLAAQLEAAAARL